MEQKGREIHEAAGASRRASQGFPGRLCVAAAGPWTPYRVCLCASRQERQVGVESRTKTAAGAEGGSQRGVGGSHSSAPRPRPGHRGRCRPRSAQLRRREAEPGVFPEVPSRQCIPAATLGSRGRRRHGEAAAAALPAGARSAGGGARGWVAAGECARLAGELRGGGPATGAPRLASRAEPASLLHRHTPTQLHRVPPSTRRPRWPPPRLGQRDPATSPGLVPLSENLLIFSPSLQPPLVWAVAAAGGWGLQAGKGGDDRGRLLFFLKDAFDSSQCGFCEPSY